MTSYSGPKSIALLLIILGKAFVSQIEKQLVFDFLFTPLI
jgi:hypothetical protein